MGHPLRLLTAIGSLPLALCSAALAAQGTTTPSDPIDNKLTDLVDVYPFSIPNAHVCTDDGDWV